MSPTQSSRSSPGEHDAGVGDGTNRTDGVVTARRVAGPKAGRNLPAAIAVGLGLGALIVASLAIQKEAFLVIVGAAVAVGVWELRTALAQVSIHVPLVPALVGSVSMLVTAYVRGGEALTVTLGLTCIAVLLWRVADGVGGAMRDIGGGMFVAMYPAFLAGFAALLLASPDGVGRILVFLIVTVCSDVGGYVAGVLFGRHPMAPSVSPKKSWEGFAGSALFCAVGGAVTVALALDGPWWAGAVLGLLVAPAATIGDLVESTIKRDLGIKDMGNILPGHGGVMDRLDSLVVVAPLVWALLAVLVPLA